LQTKKDGNQKFYFDSSSLGYEQLLLRIIYRDRSRPVIRKAAKPFLISLAIGIFSDSLCADVESIRVRKERYPLIEHEPVPYIEIRQERSVLACELDSAFSRCVRVGNQAIFGIIRRYFFGDCGIREKQQGKDDAER
jgi:hypothetical protein